MIGQKKVLAIVPARAGSKRVPNKNIKLICNKPLISWTFEAIKKSKYVDSVFVSTDSVDVQEISDLYQFESRPLRPKNLSGDHATTIEVVLHVLGSLKDHYDILVLLQPTSPLRDELDIDAALEFYINRKSKSVISVCEMEVHPTWSTPLDDDLSLDKLRLSLSNKRSQDLEKYYRLNGAIYIVDLIQFALEKSFLTKSDCHAFVMNKMKSVDIDTQEDFDFADFLMRGKGL